MLRQTMTAGTIIVCLGASFAQAERPVLQSEKPVVHLVDNLEEPNKLGWCIDTVGRGFAEKLHAHSCKPAGRGRDIQFSLDLPSGQIRSVTYEGKCMTLSDPDNKSQPFGLLDCEPDNVLQHFFYMPGELQLKLRSDLSKCVVVAPESKAAGPYMSRDLIYADCESVERKYKRWIAYR